MNNIDILTSDNHDDELMHYGVGHLDGGHSGRWPWGSGDNPCQRYGDFLSQYRRLEADGKSDKEIAELLDCYDFSIKAGKEVPSVKRLKARLQLAQAEERVAKYALALKTIDECGGNKSEAARKLGMNESSLRSLIDPKKLEFKTQAFRIAEVLADYVDENQMIDVGSGAEVYLGVTDSRLDTTLELMKELGYHVYNGKVKQMGTNYETTMTVLCAPDISYGEFMQRRLDVKPAGDITQCQDADGEVTSLGLVPEYIHSVSSDRIKVRYNEEGGIEADGLIELRRNVDDISIGASNYAQVRIPVDGTHYLKGMAVYNDNMPPGVDIIFNTNKHLGTPLTAENKDDPQVLKPMKKTNTGDIDWDQPFGASVTPLKYTDENGETRYSSSFIVNPEGKWQEWDKNVPAQMGAKQPIKVIKPQLDKEYENSKEEFEEICKLTNNTVKRKLLMDFAENQDAGAVELKAAPFPGQQTHVLLPNSSVKETEIFAPNYDNGTKVALIRFPHASITEIPILTVNNNNKAAKQMIGDNAPDAVVINYKAGQRLSGADYDGDTALVIPISDKANIRNANQYKELIGFDPSERYPGYKGMEVIKPATKQLEMGKTTNLIQDMTLQSADSKELARALMHSMVIIDSEKHQLDYKRSELENGIKDLKQKYQGDDEGHTGAATLITRAGAPTRVPERKDWSPSPNSIDPKTGEKIYVDTERTYTEGKLVGTKTKVFNPETGRYRTETTYPEGVKVDKSGWTAIWKDKDGREFYLKEDSTTKKKVRVYVQEGDLEKTRETPATQEVDRMTTVKDAMELTSGGSREKAYPMEVLYGDYANKKKALANAARLEWLHTSEDSKDPEAAKIYKAQVDSLNEKLLRARSNAPLEREAQRRANREFNLRKEYNPDMSDDQAKKYKQQAINAARVATGSSRKRRLIQITDDEWEAIQQHAIAPTTLKTILNNADMDTVRKLATPKETSVVSPAMIQLAKSLASKGSSGGKSYTNAEIANRLGVSPATVSNILNGKIT